MCEKRCTRKSRTLGQGAGGKTVQLADTPCRGGGGLGRKRAIAALRVDALLSDALLTGVRLICALGRAALEHQIPDTMAQFEAAVFKLCQRAVKRLGGIPLACGDVAFHGIFKQCLGA